MQYNVSQLLLEPIGSTRSFLVSPTRQEPPGYSRPIDEASGHNAIGDETLGSVRMLRTHRGILVHASVDVQTPLKCSRCLSDYRQASSLDIEEEYIPQFDLPTGRPVATELEDSSFFRIGGDHILDLDEAVRQYAIVDQPMKPLCKIDCSGLCHSCGANLNVEQCGCKVEALDPRWGALAGLSFPD